MHICIILLTFVTVIHVSRAANILGIIPMPSFSHQVVFRPIWKNLSLRGHRVTVVTSDPMNDASLTNLTEIDVGFSYKFFTTEKIQQILMNEETDSLLKLFNMMDIYVESMTVMTKEQLQHPDVQNLIRNESLHFDLVMVEAFQPVMFAFGSRFRCPVIGMLSLDATLEIHGAMGNPTNPTLYPDWMLPFEGKLSFSDRVHSFMYSIIFKLIGLILRPMLDAIIIDNFGANYPTSEELALNMDMLFLNTNPVLNYLRPFVPAVIYFGGGSHLQAPKPLPKDIRDYLDSATEGFIYFSLGTNVKSKDIPEKTRSTIMQALSELPYKILWKFEADELPAKPENVKIMKWLPQQDVLRHPNVKLFITQGGYQSMEEAIFSHVPLVVIPFMSDQDANAKKVITRGYGLSIDRITMTKEALKETILEVINNKKYSQRIKEIAELALDQPMEGIEKVIWWTEYVLRHKGAKHLRSQAIDVPWYQYLLLDVILFILVVSFTGLYITYKILKATYRLARSFIPTNKIKAN